MKEIFNNFNKKVDKLVVIFVVVFIIVSQTVCCVRQSVVDFRYINLFL